MSDYLRNYLRLSRECTIIIERIKKSDNNNLRLEFSLKIKELDGCIPIKNVEKGSSCEISTTENELIDALRLDYNKIIDEYNSIKKL